MVERKTTDYIARIQAATIMATTAGGGKGSVDGTFSSFGSSTLGKVQSTVVALTKAAALSPPGTPTDISANANVYTWNSVTITWKNNGTIADTLINVSDTSSGPWTTANAAGHPFGTATTAIVTGLPPSTKKYFRLIGSNAAGQSAPSTVISYTTSEIPAPDMATGYTATVNSRGWKSLTIGWDYSPYSVRDTLIFQATSPSGPWTNATLVADSSGTYNSFTTINHPLGSATKATVIGLSAVTTYYFKIVFENTTGQSTETALFNATTINIPAPTAITVIPNTRGWGWRFVTIGWTNNVPDATDTKIQTLSGTTWFDVNLIADPSSTYNAFPTIAHPLGTTTKAIHDVQEPDVRQLYRLITVNSDGQSLPSEQFFASTSSFNAPTNGSAIANLLSFQSFTLQWTNNNSGILDTLVEYSTSASGPWMNAPLIADSSNTYNAFPTIAHPLGAATKATVCGLDPATTYYFQLTSIAAVDDQWSSAPSAPFSGTTSAFLGPTNGSATTNKRGLNSLTLSWTNTFSTDGTLISLATSASGPWMNATLIADSSNT